MKRVLTIMSLFAFLILFGWTSVFAQKLEDPHCPMKSALPDSCPSPPPTPEPKPTPAHAPKCLVAEIKEKWDLWRNASCLRGANIWTKRVPRPDDPRRMTIYPNFIQKDFNKLASWGANYVNISAPGIFTEQPPYRVDEDIYQRLNDLINMAESANLFVVLSYRTGPGRNEAVFGGEEDPPLKLVWDNQDAQQAWIEMWQVTAVRFRSRKIIVGYDLMVEPDTEHYCQWDELARCMSRGIRKVDLTTPILVGGVDDGSTAGLLKITPTGDKRTVYTVHQYEPYDYSHQKERKSVYECKDPGSVCKGMFDEGITNRLRLHGLKAHASRLLRARVSNFDQDEVKQLYYQINGFKERYNVPIAVNEFGAVRFAPNADQYVKLQMELIEKLGANHALWLWEPGCCLGYDEMNIRHGPNIHKHKETDKSDLIKVIKDDWKGLIRPAQVSGRF